MANRTEAVRLTDLAEPVYSPALQQLITEAEPLAAEMRLEGDWLCARAADETGLDDFGEDDFRERLDVYLRALEEQAELSALGLVNRCGEILRFLKNRLLVEDRIRRNPRILDIEIAKPIIITGFPRTGTTHLHNSLAADPQLRYLPYWEAVEPVLTDSEAAAFAGAETPPGAGARAEAGRAEDPRITRCKEAVAWLNDAMPHFPKMHEMTFDHAHEEIDLLALDFSTMYFETPGPIDSFVEYYRKHDQTPHYRYLYRVVQTLTFLRGGERWVLKSPQHFEQLVPLKSVFPDATVVFTHRDPLPVIASYATMITYTARLQQARPDPAKYGAYVAKRIDELLYACQRDRDVWPPAQSIDIRFKDFIADQDRAVEQVYSAAEQPLDEGSRQAIADYAASHPPGRHGRIRYDLADFGLAKEALRAQFEPYCRRFGVEAEIL